MMCDHQALTSLIHALKQPVDCKLIILMTKVFLFLILDHSSRLCSDQLCEYVVCLLCFLPLCLWCCEQVELLPQVYKLRLQSADLLVSALKTDRKSHRKSLRSPSHLHNIYTKLLFQWQSLVPDPELLHLRWPLHLQEHQQVLTGKLMLTQHSSLFLLVTQQTATALVANESLSWHSWGKQTHTR